MKYASVILLVIVSVFTFFSPSHAQFTHHFTQTARNTHYGHAEAVAVGSDGTVFLAKGAAGLMAYSYDGTAFSNTAHIDDGGYSGYAYGVAVGSDGTVFLANGWDGLIAYSYIPGTAIEDNVVPVPAQYALRHNYPNPFNPSTTIEFSLPRAGFVTLAVYNVVGQKIATLVSDNLTAGSYKYHWDSGDMPSGLYFYRIKAGGFTKSRKMLLIR